MRLPKPTNAAYAASRRAVVSTLLGLSALPALPLDAVASAAASSGLQVFAVESAALDPRSHRALILGNGLRVLLTSYPKAAKGAASMNVQVGYMTDPSALPGLAHFCEHMLFLGTKRFPNEGDFERLVASAGGSNNAYTAAEETNYFFDVNGASLRPALERFAGFFVDPLFTESATAREVNAIESEHSKNLQSDFWRYEQLFKLRADPSHPYAKFGTGNRQTLRDGDAGARTALLDFHGRYYQADQMSLSLVGPQSLDELQRVATQNFAGVPVAQPPLVPSSAAYDSLPLPFRPADSEPYAVLMEPVNDVRNLKFTWCVPVTDLDGWVRTKPDELWELLLRNRAKGGLLPLLKRKGLAAGLDGSVEEFTRTWLLLSVSVDLTPLGLTKWRAVSSMLFAYLRMLAAAGPPSALLSEYTSLARTGFEYAEPSEPESFATSASATLPFYPPQKWVSGPSTVEPGAESGLAQMLAVTSEPRNAMITLIAKSNEKAAKRTTEPIYGTSYGVLSLAREVENWSTSQIPAELAPPLPNPFVPTDFTIKAKGRTPPKSQDVAPVVLRDVDGQRVHFLQDATFRRPRGNAFFLFRSPLLYSSPQASVVAQLFQTIIADVLQDSTYQASLAGLGAALGAEYNGLFVQASGYNTRLPDLLSYVSKQLRTAELEPLAFKRQSDSLRQQLANFNRKLPVSLCSYRRGLALETPKYSVDELQAALEKTTLADVQAFQQALLPEALLEAFVVGNFEEGEATAMVDAITTALPSSAPLPADKIPRRKTRVLPVGRTLQQYAALNAAEKNSAAEVYLQVGMDEGDDWLDLVLVSQLLEQPFYAELRTKQQLGYIVQSSVSESNGVRALVFSIQSSVLPPPQVEERIDTFLTDYRATLAALSESDLDAYRESLAIQATDVDKRLGQQASRLWGEIVQRRYDYGRPWRTSRRVRKVTKEQLLAFYDRVLMPGAPAGRRLTTHVFAKSAAPPKLVLEKLPDEFYPPPPDLSSKITSKPRLEA